MKVKEKKVELIELFYGLIYVYAISKLTMLIEEPENGGRTGERGHSIRRILPLSGRLFCHPAGMALFDKLCEPLWKMEVV